MPYGYADSESGAIRYPTLSSLLSTAPQPGMRATASDAPGSMLFEVGGKWGGTLGRIGADFTVLSAYSGATFAGVRALINNPLSPEGYTALYYDLAMTGWRPVPNQLLARFANADGTPLLDLTASALTVGAWSEVWTSAILPNWMVLQPHMKLSLGADTLISDATSTATEKLRISMRSAALSEGDVNDSILGHTAAATNYPKGFSSGRADFIVSNGSLLVTPGPSWWSSIVQARRFAGTVGSSPRLRIDFGPGANTNRIVHYSASLYSA